MSVCSVPGCGQTAVLQWQRAGSAVERDAAAEAAQRGQEAVLDHQRDSARLHMVELRARCETVAARAEAGDRDAATVLPMVRAQLAAAEGTLADLEGVVPVPVVVGEVTVAVFGCELHEVGPDVAARLHGVGCASVGPCDCDDLEVSGPVGPEPV